MSYSAEKVLVVIGCGPGIGLATASLFAAHSFGKIALIARDSQRLQSHRADILKAAAAEGREPTVQCWALDITDSNALSKAFGDVQKMGPISCVFFNAARVGPSELLQFEEEALIKDFLTTNVALHTTAKWAIPLLLEQGQDRPTILVTNSLLWQEPIPPLFSLSMTKASQRNMVQSMQATFKDVHIVQLYVAGPVTPEDKVRNPSLIAKKFLDLYVEEKGSWTLEAEI